MIKVDATGQGYVNGTNLTYSHVVTGSDPALIVSIFGFSGTQPAVTAIAYAGEPMTEKGKILSDASGYTYQWGMVGANTGTNSIVMTNSSSQVFATSVSYTGVDQTNPFPDTTLTSSGTGSSFNVSTTNLSVNNSFIVMSGRSPSRTALSSSDGVVRIKNTTSGDAGWTIDSAGARSSGANTLNFSYTGGSQTSYWVISNLAPADVTLKSSATADNWLDNNVKTNNWGSWSSGVRLGDQGGSDGARPIVRFVMPSDPGGGVTITKIEISLFLRVFNAASGADIDMYYGSNTPATTWTEGTGNPSTASSSWNTYTTGNNWTTAGGLDDFTTLVDTYSVVSTDVNTYNPTWVLYGTGATNPISATWGDSVNVLFRAASSASKQFDFYSRTHPSTAFPPLITVTYSTGITASIWGIFA